jgi:hypothetical protein
MTLPVMNDATLECPGCGLPAISSASGLFCEDEGEACMTCGHPGHVNVDTDIESDVEGAEGGAYWWSAEECGPTCHHDSDGRELPPNTDYQTHEEV